MADKKLIYEIIFDLKQKGIEGLNTVRKEAVQLEIQFEDVGAAAAKMLDTMPAQAEKAAVVGKAVENIGTEIDEVAAKGKRMTDALSQPKGVANINAHRQSFNGLNMSINQVVRELPAATMGMNMFFLAISNNLPILADNLKAASIEAKALKDAGQQSVPVWKQVLKGFLSWQTALVMGVTVLSMYGKDILKFAGNLLTLDSAAAASRRSLEQVNKFSKSFNAELVSELSNLRYVYQALTMTSEGTMARKSAIEDLNKKYKDYMPYLLSEKSTLSEIDTVYKAINTSLREQVALKTKNAVVDDIQKEAQKEQEKAIGKLEEGLRKQGIGESLAEKIIIDLVQSVPKFKDSGVKLGKAVTDAYTNASIIAPSININASGIGTGINDFVKSFYEADDAISKVEKRLRLMLGITDEINSIGEVVVTPPKKKLKNSKKKKESFKLEDLTQDTIADIREQMQKKLDKVKEAPITIYTPVQIDAAVEKVDLKGSIEEKQRLLEATQVAMSETTNSDLRKIYKKRVKSLEESLEEMQTGVKKTMVNIKQDIESLVSGSIVSTFEVLGETLGGGGLESFQDYLISMMDLLKQFGAALVAAGVAKIAFDNLLWSGPGAIIAGGALIVAASAASAALRATKMADGGVVSGPTFAMVGEYPGAQNNPEVVAPLNKLKKMIEPKNSNMSGEVNFVINGYTLQGVLNKINKKINRVR